MTHCLNCGAERDADICEACGLSTAAAEFSLRKNLLNRTAVFLAGGIAFVAASGRYPALELDPILIFIGLLFFLTLGLGMIVERRVLKHQEVEVLKRLYYALIPVPWLLALMLFGNGAFDSSKPQTESARVIGKFAMMGPVPSRRLIVSSWREDRHLERVPVDRGDFDRFTSGDVVEVQVHGGLIGIPWVSGVSRE